MVNTILKINGLYHVPRLIKYEVIITDNTAENPTNMRCEILIDFDRKAGKLPTTPETNTAKNELAKVYGTKSVVRTPFLIKK